MLLVRLLVNGKLLVAKFWGNQKLQVDFFFKPDEVFKKYLFIYLAASDLSRGMRDLSLWHVSSLSWCKVFL